MNQKTKYKLKLEDRSEAIGLCLMIKLEIAEALNNGQYGFAEGRAKDLYWSASRALKSKIGGTTNLNGFINYSKKVKQTCKNYHNKMMELVAA